MCMHVCMHYCKMFADILTMCDLRCGLLLCHTLHMFDKLSFYQDNKQCKFIGKMLKLADQRNQATRLTYLPEC